MISTSARILSLLLPLLAAACGSDGDNTTPDTDYFNAYLPYDLPVSTHQTEMVWQARPSTNNGGGVTAYNELTGETTYAFLSSETTCYDYIWLFYFYVKVDFCDTDYAYLMRVPLGIGANTIQIESHDAGGHTEDTQTYIVTRYEYTPIDESEPNDDYYDALVLSLPAVVLGNQDDIGGYDTYTFTPDTSRNYTVVITGTEDVTATTYSPYINRDYPTFRIEDNLTRIIIDSNDDNHFFAGEYLNGRYANIALTAGQKVYISVCCYGGYLLGVY